MSDKHLNGTAAVAVMDTLPESDALPTPTAPSEPAFLSLAYFDKAISEGEAVARQLYGIYAGTDAFQQWQQVVAQLDLLRRQRQQLVDGS